MKMKKEEEEEKKKEEKKKEEKKKEVEVEEGNSKEYIQLYKIKDDD
jgi:hypothetical protein